MFLPKLTLDRILAIQDRTPDAVGASLLDIKYWLHCSNEHTRAVIRRDFHSRLLRNKVIGTKDMKKINKLYGGWGLTAGQSRGREVEREKNASMVKIALEFLSERLQHYQREEEFWRA